MPAKSGDHVLDIGSGVGAAALCLLRRVEGCLVTALECTPELCALAAQNRIANGMMERMSIVAANLLDWRSTEIRPQSFHHIMANPPYLPAHRTTTPQTLLRREAKMEGDAELADWLRFAAKMVRPKGSVTFIHRADRLEELLTGMAQEGLGGLVIYPLWPKAGHPARRVLVQGIAHSRAPTVFAPGLVLHESNGQFTSLVHSILWQAETLDLKGRRRQSEERAVINPMGN